MSQYASYSGYTGGGGGGGSGVTSLNALTGALSLVAGSSGTDFTISSAVSTITINLPTASASNRGLLSSADWTTFNNKQSTLTLGNLTDAGTDGIVITGGTGAVVGSGTSIAQHVADSTHNGYLSSTDWSTFNNKQATVTIGALDAQAANATGLALVSNVLSTQSADSTHPGMVNNTTQTLSGAKTFSSDLTISSTSTTALVINTNALIVDATAKALGVGIAPSANCVVDLLAQSSATTQNLQLTNYDNAGNAGLKIRRSRGTSGSPSAVQSNDSLGFAGGLGYGATAFGANVKSSVSFFAGENWTDSAQGAYLTLNSTPTGSTTRAERARVTPSGRVLINTTTDDGANQLQVNGNIVATNLSGTNTGDVTLTAVGASPNANGASLSGQALTLQPASGTQPGLMTAGSQTIGGAKTFSSTISASNLSGTNTGDQTITLTGDITGSGTGSFATTLATVNGNVGTFGSASLIPVITVNGKGLITAVTTAANTNGFQYFNSTQVTTNSSNISSGSFATFSNSPAFSVACTVTGKYKIYTSAPLFITAAGTEAISKIVNTSGGASLVAESQCAINDSAGSMVSTNMIQSVYTLTTGNTYVFDIQAKILSGTAVQLFGADSPFYMFAELCG